MCECGSIVLLPTHKKLYLPMFSEKLKDLKYVWNKPLLLHLERTQIVQLPQYVYMYTS